MYILIDSEERDARASTSHTRCIRALFAVLRFILSGCLLCSPASADPAPQVSRIVWGDASGEVVLVTNRGLVFADVDGTRFHLMCNQALGVGIGDPPAIAYLGPKRWLAATTPGLKSTVDGGCTWQAMASLGTMQTPALAQSPENDRTVFVSTFGAGESGVRVTHDAGASWSTVLALDDNEFTHSLLIAPSDSRTIYAAGISFDDAGNFSHYVERSSDGGASWQRSALELGMLDERGALLAVNPQNAHEVIVATRTLAREAYAERLLVSRDGGDHFEPAFEGPVISAASYAADGSALWIANQDGIWHSNDGARSFSRLGIASWMSCAQNHNGRLWGCGQFGEIARGHDGIGISLDDGQSFLPWMTFNEVTRPLACAADAQTTQVCEQAWAHWQVEVLGLAEPSPVTIDAGGSGGNGGVIDSSVIVAADAVAEADAGNTTSQTRTGRSSGCGLSREFVFDMPSLTLFVLALSGALGSRIRARHSRNR